MRKRLIVEKTSTRLIREDPYKTRRNYSTQRKVCVSDKKMSADFAKAIPRIPHRVSENYTLCCKTTTTSCISVASEKFAELGVPDSS